tara:strand:- start:3244 stop:4524 length:1281 start_codon:yes stop_codon:yes gene_type:complete
MMTLIFFLVLLIFPAFFAASEIAILMIRPSRVLRLIEERNKAANSILNLQRRLRSTLMAAQFGVTISLIAIGWLGNGISEGLLNKEFENIYLYKTLDLLFFSIIVITVTLLAGLIPKAIVLSKPEKAALEISGFFEAVVKGMKPITSLLEILATSLLKIFGLNTQWASLKSGLSAGELETLIETGGVTGLKPDEKNILEGVFALRDTQVREVMIPRSEMVTLPRNVTFSQLMKKVDETKHARFFVLGESLDEVLGVLDLRILAKPISRGEMQAHSSLENHLLPVTKVIETCSLAEILPLVIDGNPFLLVVDEHGGTEGLITAADLTGEIVGDDIETNSNAKMLRQIASFPEKWSVAGKLEIIELNKKLSLKIPESEDHHTLAGFLLEKFQDVPKIGDVITFNNNHFEIISMSGPRIDRVKIILPKN